MVVMLGNWKAGQLAALMVDYWDRKLDMKLAVAMVDLMVV
jgi:hypothetical protein